MIQIYVAPKGGTVIRPVRELRAFDKIGLNPGETKTVTFLLDRRAFAYWNTEIHDWHVESGEYEIQIGENAQDIVLSSTVTVNSVTDIPKVYTRNSTMGEILADPKGKEIFQKAMAQMLGDNAQLIAAQEDNSGAINEEMMTAMAEGMPLRQMLSFIPGVSRNVLEDLINKLNEI